METLKKVAYVAGIAGAANAVASKRSVAMER